MSVTWVTGAASTNGDVKGDRFTLVVLCATCSPKSALRAVVESTVSDSAFRSTILTLIGVELGFDRRTTLIRTSAVSTSLTSTKEISEKESRTVVSAYVTTKLTIVIS